MESAGSRYFAKDCDILARRLEDHFHRMGKRWPEVEGMADSLVLGGGYGRGEGGVMMTDRGPELFNDLDYFLFTKRPADPRLAAWCHDLEKEETRALGIDVEIKRLTPDLGNPSESMMFHDLVAGHKVVAGEAEFLKKLQERLDPGRISLDEASRLLWNRGSGLYFSRERFRSDPSFVTRNHAKLKLALGDAWLCANGRYVSSALERGRRFAEMELPEGFEKLRAWHAEGVDFKCSPIDRHARPEDFERESDELAEAFGEVFLAIERKRLGEPFSDYAEYLSRRRVFPDSSRIRNCALALRDLLKSGACLRPIDDYPRGALFRALPCLLGVRGARSENVARFLPMKTGKGMTCVGIYTGWWSRYN